jgi:hypothetical protein
LAQLFLGEGVVFHMDGVSNRTNPYPEETIPVRRSGNPTTKSMDTLPVANLISVAYMLSNRYEVSTS